MAQKQSLCHPRPANDVCSGACCHSPSPQVGQAQACLNGSHAGVVQAAVRVRSRGTACRTADSMEERGTWRESQATKPLWPRGICLWNMPSALQTAYHAVADAIEITVKCTAGCSAPSRHIFPGSVRQCTQSSHALCWQQLSKLCTGCGTSQGCMPCCSAHMRRSSGSGAMGLSGWQEWQWVQLPSPVHCRCPATLRCAWGREVAAAAAAARSGSSSTSNVNNCQAICVAGLWCTITCRRWLIKGVHCKTPAPGCDGIQKTRIAGLYQCCA